jgi:hypothetical protein
MKIFGAGLLLLAAAAVNCPAQQWEVGVAGGGSFLNTVNVSSPSGPAKAGFQNGFVLGAFVGQHLYPHLSGELRYEYFQTDLKITAGSTTGKFSGMAHAVHYDLLMHTNAEKPVQVFGALGLGVKIFDGTGAQTAFQATQQYGLMTQTHEVKIMGSVGGGFRFRLSPRVYLRAEARDFITPFPTKVITPPSSSVKYGSVLHDLVPMVGLEYVF